MKKAQCIATVFLLLVALGLTFPGDRQAGASEPSGELRIGLATLYDQTFHPTYGSVFRKEYLGPMYDFLIGVDKDGKFDPKQGIAYKWEEAADKLSWTFYIRDGVKFHNGDPLTIEDVKFTIEDTVSKKNLHARAEFEARLDRVVAIPPNKVVVHLKKAWPTMIYWLSDLTGTEGMTQPKKYIQEKGDKYFTAHPIGSGPYKLFEWKEGAYIKLVAQDSHWRVGVPKYKYLTFKLLPEEGTRVAALKAGEVDFIPVTIPQLKGLEDAGYIVQRKKDGLQIGLNFLRMHRPEFPTNNIKVRQALIYAIDKAAIVKEILQGQGKVIGHHISMLTWSLEYKPYPVTPYDPETAKRLLKEAGYPNGFDIYLYSFALFIPELKTIVEAVASYWEAIGVRVKLLEMEYAAYRAVWGKQSEPPGCAASLMVFPNRPVYAWVQNYRSTAMWSHTKDSTLDGLIDDFEGQASLVGYIAKAQKIMDYVLANHLGSGMCTVDSLFVQRNNIPKWELGRNVASLRWEYIGIK